MEHEEAPTTEAANESGRRPAAQFTGSGGLNVAVWKHKNDKGYDNYSVKLERSYKDSNGEYHTTPYLRDDDLLRAQKLLEQADTWIERDKGRVSGQATGQSR
jgi:hypothetical protein